jgi:hypothetical protein
MIFYVGRKVVFVNGRIRRDGLFPYYPSTALPVVGSIYTIREVFDARPYGYDEAAILLDEVVNPVRRYIAPAGPVRCEQFFLGNRFRPLHDTSIEIFTQMLQPVPTAPAEPVET